MQGPSASQDLYKCIYCQANNKKFRGQKKMVVDHILKYHVPLDRIPYSCRLCQFRCTDQEALINHVTWYKRHIEAAKEQADSNYIQHMTSSKNPIKLDHTVLAPLNEEESFNYYSENTTTEMKDLKGEKSFWHKGASVSMQSPNKPVMSHPYLDQTAPLYRGSVSCGRGDDTQEPPNKKRPSQLVTQRQPSATAFNTTEAESASSQGGDINVVETIQTCCRSIVEAIRAHDKTLKGVVKELQLLNRRAQRRWTSGTDDVDSKMGQVKKPTPK